MALTVSNLIEQYSEAEPEIVIELAKGEKLRFRALRDMTDMYRIEKAAQAFAKRSAPAEAPAEWQPYTSPISGVRRSCYYVSELSVEPKITQLEALQLAQAAGPLVSAIFAKLMGGVASVVSDDEAKELAELGEG